MEKIILGSDHAAFKEKEEVSEYLSPKFEIINVGTHSENSCHYPEFAAALAREVIKNNSRGILFCGSGVGVSMVANKYKGIRAALVRTKEEAKLSREHNNSNVLCIGARVTPMQKIKEIIEVWLETPFEGGRHQSRLDLFENLGEEIK